MDRNGIRVAQLLHGAAPDTRRMVAGMVLLGVALMGAVAYTL